jgi:hypothetical protein
MATASRLRDAPVLSRQSRAHDRQGAAHHLSRRLSPSDVTALGFAPASLDAAVASY